MKNRSLFDRIGREPVVRRASDLLFARIMLDDRLNHLFEGLDVTELVRKQTQFLTCALGGPATPGTDRIGAIYRCVVARGFNHNHFNVVVELLRTTLNELGLSPTHIEEIIFRVEITRKDILNKSHEILKETTMFARLSTFVYGVVAYVLGMASLVYLAGFIGNFLVPTRLDAPATGSPGVAILINLSLLLLFAIQHSGMARPTFKKVWTRLIPETVERSTYVLFSALALLPIFAFWQPMGITMWEVRDSFTVIAIYTAYALGWFVVVFSTFLINHFDLFGLRQVWLNVRGNEYTHLPFGTPLLYRIVRHPLYLGWLIVMWATPTMTISHLVFAVALTAYVFIAIRLEERNLREFHPEYEAYSRDVPMILPTGSNTKRPSPVGGRPVTHQSEF